MAEILAPAGDASAYEAALNSGADAIYLGLTDFSARKSAVNFSLENLSEYTARAHVFGVKIYVALNTLVKDSELEAFFETARAAWNAGADALILQDVFLGRILHRTYPEIVLHLSTQAGVCNEYGAKLAVRYGFSRVILARETPIEDIKKIARIVETEVFVQGALCTCFSGQCYFSSFAGGNSGNRGYCKQPCRKRYKIDRRGFEDYSYKLSLSDLCCGKDLDELQRAGVSSFKIEGRMRSPAYVGSAVSYYRGLLDGRSEQALSKAYSDLKRCFNRGNYTRGYAFGQDKNLLSDNIQGHIGEKVGVLTAMRGKDKYIFVKSSYSPADGDGFKVIRKGRAEVGGGVWRKYYPSARGGFYLLFQEGFQEGDDVCLTNDIRLSEDIAVRSRKIPLSVYGEIVKSEKPRVRISGGFGELVFSADFVADPAKNRSFTSQDFNDCFSKTDRFPFEIDTVSAKIDGDVFIVRSALNAFRREVFSSVYRHLAGNRETVEKRGIGREDGAGHVNDDLKIAVIDTDFKSPCYRTSKICHAIFKPCDYNNLTEISDFIRIAEYYAWRKWIYLPAFSIGEDLERFLKLTERFDGIYAEGVFALELCREKGIPLFAGTGFNLFNRMSVAEAYEDGAGYVCLSKELSGRETEKIGGCFYVLKGGCVRLMDLGHCVFKKRCGDCDRRDRYFLTDESGRRFPLRRYENSCCRFEVYNNVPLVADHESGGTLYDFTISDDKEKQIFLSDEVRDFAGGYTAGASRKGIR